MDVLVDCKNEDSIENKGARVVTTLFIDFSDAQGQLTPKSGTESCRNTNSSKLLWSTMLHKVSLIISLWRFFQTLKGSLLISPSLDTAQFRTHPRFYDCLRYLQE